MSCGIGEATESLENELRFQSLHLCHSSFSNPSVTLPTSQFILKSFRYFTYVTAHYPTLLSLLLRHRFSLTSPGEPPKECTPIRGKRSRLFSHAVIKVPKVILGQIDPSILHLFGNGCGRLSRKRNARFIMSHTC